VAILGLLAVVGVSPATASAQQKDTRTTQTRDQRHADLERLKAELREHEQKLREARRDRDREAVRRAEAIIKKLKEQIRRLGKR
jgi:hypothetical protein